VTATIDGSHYRLRAPAAWMIAPGVVHGFVYQRDSTGHVATVPTALLHKGLAPSRSLEDALHRPVVVRRPDSTCHDEPVHPLFAGLAREFREGRPGRAEALQAHAVLLALWFLRRAAEARAPAPSSAVRPPHDALVQEFRALVEARFRAHWTVSDYAKTLGITPDHLSRRCRTATGMGALELVHERLMLEARRLIAYTPATIAEIAHQLGFDDPAYFSRLFARRTGQSPSAYREAMALGLAHIS
jgi:AraC family transcriptional activator of pobA